MVQLLIEAAAAYNANPTDGVPLCRAMVVVLFGAAALVPAAISSVRCIDAAWWKGNFSTMTGLKILTVTVASVAISEAITQTIDDPSPDLAQAVALESVATVIAMILAVYIGIPHGLPRSVPKSSPKQHHKPKMEWAAVGTPEKKHTKKLKTFLVEMKRNSVDGVTMYPGVVTAMNIAEKLHKQQSIKIDPCEIQLPGGAESFSTLGTHVCEVGRLGIELVVRVDKR